MQSIEDKTNNIQKKLLALQSYDPPSLSRPDLGIELSLEIMLDSFQAIALISKALAGSSLSAAPHSQLDALDSTLATVISHYDNQVLKWTPSMHQSDPWKAREDLITRTQKLHEQLHMAASGVLAISVAQMKAQIVADLEAEMQRRVASADEWIGKLEVSAEKADTIVKTSADAAEKLGIAKQAIHFTEAANQHSKSARKWLTATTLAALALILGAGYFVILLPPLDPAGVSSEIALSVHRFNLIQRGLAKLLLFSTLFTVVVWCGRIYRAHRHNEIVNRHRANALATFRIFTETQIDQSTRDAVLLQSTQCIFAPQPSGYVQGEQDSHPASQVLEVIRGIGGK